jgi:ParB/RepB/Spo0J family partition protein
MFATHRIFVGLSDDFSRAVRGDGPAVARSFDDQPRRMDPEAESYEDARHGRSRRYDVSKGTRLSRFPTMPRIRESTTNPRQRFDDLEELAASIRAHGVLQPILVRPLRKDFELILGARRLRGARLAGLTSVPAQVKPLDDRSVREVQLRENLQRQDVHPLEEADGYKALLDSTPCTTDEIAAKVGKSKAYVYQRLSLTRLAPQVRDVVAADALPLSYALKLAPLDAATQLEALERCLRPLGGDAEHLAKICANDLARTRARLSVGAPLRARGAPRCAQRQDRPRYALRSPALGTLSASPAMPPIAPNTVGAFRALRGTGLGVRDVRQPPRRHPPVS